MASINDLATAATIASSAVALQSSPQQSATQPEEAQAQQPPAQDQTQAQPQSSPVAAPASAAAPPSAQQQAPTTPSSVQAPAAVPPLTGSSTTSVLAPPQISGQDPAEAKIPAPAPVTSDLAATAAAAAAAAAAGEAMEGVDGPGAITREKPVRGAFIVFEGMDRAGKTTQAKLLQQRCIELGRDVKFMRFPDRTTPIGQMIDAYLKGQAEIEDHVIHLLFSANRWEAVKSIQQHLTAGTTIICDRYYHSGIVYSAAKQNPSLSLNWAKAPEVGLPRPDAVVFLDLEESVARERGGWGGEVYEKGEMQRRVRELFWGLSYGDLSQAVKKDGGERENGVAVGPLAPTDAKDFRQEQEDLLIVEAALGIEELAEKVWETVQPKLEAVERGEGGKTVRIVK